MESSILILIQLLMAHLLTDFVLQPGSWIEHKRKYKGKSYVLVLHALLAGALTYLFLLNVNWWYVALFIAISHYFIDLWKLTKENDNLRFFTIDQALHLLMIFIAWLFLTKGFSEIIPIIKKLLTSTKALVVIGAYISVIFPAGFLIEKATKRWQKEIETNQVSYSLDAAGRYIGIFERLLVLTFILTNNFSAIGFLIAAKSILRFSDKSETGARKQTEYVLIGTLISFTITVFIGLLVRYFLFQ